MANFYKEKELVQELCCIQMAGYFKVNGLTILNMEKDIRSFKMEQSIQELIPMGNLKDMAYILGRMDKLMKENGLMV